MDLADDRGQSDKYFSKRDDMARLKCRLDFSPHLDALKPESNSVLAWFFLRPNHRSETPHPTRHAVLGFALTAVNHFHCEGEIVLEKMVSIRK